jgi:polyhydroxyalkanoate synthesis regulator phasin
MDLKTPKEVVRKSAFVAVGAPVVVARKVKDFSNKMMADAQTQIDEYATEGEKVTKQLKDRNVVEELEHRMNIDKVQDRVEKLRDQLENTLNNWRESFSPESEKKTEEPEKAPAAKKAPAKKAPAAKKTTAKKAPAKKPAAKKTAAAAN